MEQEYVIRIQGSKLKVVADGEKILISVNMIMEDVKELMKSGWTLLGNESLQEILTERGYSLIRQRKKKEKK